MTLDNDTRRLYISHASQVDVVNVDTGKLAGGIDDTKGVHGIAIAHGLNHGFTSNGAENTVTVFDATSLKVMEKVPVGKGPDGIFYDAATKRIFTCNHGSDDITALDAATGKVLGTVKVGGGGEQMVAASNGLLYVNIEDTAEVVAFDPKTLEIKHRFPIGVGKTPNGLAIDAKNNRLFIGSRKVMVAMDAANGKVIKPSPSARAWSGCTSTRMPGWFLSQTGTAR